MGQTLAPTKAFPLKSMAVAQAFSDLSVGRRGGFRSVLAAEPRPEGFTRTLGGWCLATVGLGN